MKNFIILTPTFNDWKSLNKLLKQIDKNVYKIKGNFGVFVIDDASTIKLNLSLQRLKKLKKITIMTNNKNLGSQKSIYLGLKYLKKVKVKSIIIVMDSDGEDDPKKIKELIKLAIKNPDSIITANRLKREKDFTLIKVTAPPDIRLKRIINRNREKDPKTLEELKEKEARENTHNKYSQQLNKIQNPEIQININYPVPIHKMKAYKSKISNKPNYLPITEKMANGIFSLPLYPNLKKADILKVSGVIKKILLST